MTEGRSGEEGIEAHDYMYLLSATSLLAVHQAVMTRCIYLMSSWEAISLLINKLKSMQCVAKCDVCNV